MERQLETKQESAEELLLELLNKYENAKSMQIAHATRNPDRELADLEQEISTY